MYDSAESTSSTTGLKKSRAEVRELLNQSNLPTIVAGNGQVEFVLRDSESGK